MVETYKLVRGHSISKRAIVVRMIQDSIDFDSPPGGGGYADCFEPDVINLEVFGTVEIEGDVDKMGSVYVEEM